MPKPRVRRPTHAGSWYDDDGAPAAARPPRLRRRLAGRLAIESARRLTPFLRRAAVTLAGKIEAWMRAARGGDAEDGGGAAAGAGAPRAVIAPHAGYSYCGHVMAHAYKFLRPERMCAPEAFI
jgi:AmmeMemoRadiSam system protein B